MNSSKAQSLGERANFYPNRYYSLSHLAMKLRKVAKWICNFESRVSLDTLDSKLQLLIE